MCKKQVRLFSYDYMINDNEIRLKMKNRSHRYDINRPRPRHKHTYIIYKMYLEMICYMYYGTPKQNLKHNS